MLLIKLSHVNGLQEIRKIQIDSKVSFQYFDTNHIQIEASLILLMMKLIHFLLLITTNLIRRRPTLNIVGLSTTKSQWL